MSRVSIVSRVARRVDGASWVSRLSRDCRLSTIMLPQSFSRESSAFSSITAAASQFSC
jgi:hypothetical protein